MTFPTVTVEVAFVSDPLDTTPTWTDITDDTYSISTVVGRSVEFDQFQPGTLTVVLDNTNRTYDPLHTTGTHHGDLLPNKRIRVQATHDGDTYDLYSGFVDGWPQTYDSEWETSLTLSVADAFKLLKRTRLPVDKYADEVLSDTPRLWYRMGETSGKQLQDSSGNGRHAYGAIDIGNVSNDGLMLCSNDGGIDLDSAQWDARIPKEHLAFDYDPCSIEFWFRADKPPSGGYVGVICSSVEAGLYPDIVITYEDPGVTVGGFLQFSVVDNPSAAIRLVSGATQLCDGVPHHVVCTRSSTTLRVYVDGINVTKAPFSSGSPTSTVGAPLDLNVNYFSESYEKWEGAQQPGLDEFAIYDTDLSQSRIQAHHQAGLLLWDGDRAGERVDNVLTAIAWPSALANTDTGQAILGPATWDPDTTALDYLHLVAASEQGDLYCDHANGGVVRFRERADILSATRSLTNQAIFSDNDGDEGTVVRYSSLNLEYDTANMVNRAEVSWVGGSVVVFDQTSIDANGENSRTIETILTTKAEAEALGSWVVNRYKDAAARIRSVTINPAGQSGTNAELAWGAVLGLEIGDRVLVVRHPQDVGLEIEQPVIIVGIEHTIGGTGGDGGVNSWVTTFRCLPADGNTYWILGTSELGTDTRLAF